MCIFFQYFEQDDPELFITKVKYVLDNNVEPMELNFTEEEYSSTGQLVKVVNKVFMIVNII